MFRHVSFSPVLCRFVLPFMGLGVLPLLAGNSSGPGWQQAKAKGRAVRAAVEVPAVPSLPKLPGPPAGQRRAAPAAETLPRQVPQRGELHEEELIRLAIANHPDLTRRRAEISIARAKVAGAGDWENPELRIGYAWEHDDRLREPFMERSTERIRIDERYRQSEVQRNLAEEFYPGAGESQSQQTAGDLRTTRYRTIERKVTPGRYRDVVETSVYERRQASETFNQATSKASAGGLYDTNEAGSGTADRRLVERSRELISHPDDTSRDDQLSVLVRFTIPNPWERRANIEIAAAQTARAESDYLIEEDKVVRTVRALYEDLNMAESVARGARARQALQEKFGSEMEALQVPDLADLVADIRLEVGKSIRVQREFRSDIARLRQELAGYCGLDQPERIGVMGKPSRRVVPLEALDFDYLVRMAQLQRSDLLDLEARLALAQAELKGAKAAKIPFFTFFDVGWATAQTTGRTSDSEEWSVRAGVSLPIFDWIGLNKAHLEHRTATEAYRAEIEAQRVQIAGEIRTALERIRSASRELSAYDADLARIRQNAEKSIAQTAADRIRNAKTRYQNEDLISKFEEDRYEVWSDYYKAVMELEHALGGRLELVLKQ